MAKDSTAREVPFSKVRQQLSTMIDEVQKQARPVTILRHGKPAAVLISHDEFQSLQARAKRRTKWKLAGSLKLRKTVDIDKVLEDEKKERIRITEKNATRFARNLNES